MKINKINSLSGKSKSPIPWEIVLMFLFPLVFHETSFLKKKLISIIFLCVFKITNTVDKKLYESFGKDSVSLLLFRGRLRIE